MVSSVVKENALTNLWVKKTRPWMCRDRQEVELLNRIKIQWNFVFNGPKRRRLQEPRGQKEEGERRGGPRTPKETVVPEGGKEPARRNSMV